MKQKTKKFRAMVSERKRVLAAIKSNKPVLVQCRTCRQHKHHSMFRYNNWDWNLCKQCKRPKKPAAKHRLEPDDAYLDAHIREITEFISINLSNNNINV